MVEIKSINIDSNTVEYADHEKVDYGKFYDQFTQHWNKRIAGETIGPFDMERFMKRGSSKNLKQLLEGKKIEGILEATRGKTVDPGWIRTIIIIGIIGIIICIVFILLHNFHII